MAPAFSSSRQAAAFALLLALLLGCHAWLFWTNRLNRINMNARSSKLHVRPGDTRDVDIAILGSSSLKVGVNTPYLQKALSDKLKREAEVFTIGWGRSGNDILYFNALRLLDQRRVHTLLIYNEPCPHSNLHWESFHWWSQITEDSEAMRDLTMRDKVGLYGASAVAIPRYLMGLIRQDYSIDDDRRRAFVSNARNQLSSPDLGALRVRNNYGGSHDFSLFQPILMATPEDVLVYSAKTRAFFNFDVPSPPPLHLHFARQLARLCKARGTQLVIIQLPFFAELGRTTISVNPPWLDFVGHSVYLIGIPNSKVFANIPASELQQLFYDDWHLNLNGQDMFTKLITPALLKVYSAAPEPP